jgi:hypothetical protein
MGDTIRGSSSREDVMRRFSILASLLLLAACSEEVRRGDAAGDRSTTDGQAREVSPPTELGQRDTGAPPPDSGTAPSCPGGNKPGSLPNGTIPGQLTLPHPTLTNVSVLWLIQGDANNNGEVRVRFRKKGESLWRLAMPLRRVPAGSTESFSWPNRHAGSIFDLQPATTYEVELWLKDPDGGCHTETQTVTTRAVPAPMAGAPVKPATPSTFSSIADNAQPGDIIELAAGTYGGFSFEKDGLPGKPIVIRSTAGAKFSDSISIRDRKHVHLVGLTVTSGRIRFDDSDSIAIMKCKVQASSSAAGDGIITWSRAQDAYIADNEVTGVSTWAESSVGASGDNLGEGILVNGPGHVIEHNRVTGFRDNISFVEDSSVDQYSIDVLDNDIVQATDDGVEADFCQHNCRIMRNRFTNVFVAMSSQPGLGGPCYFIRNVVYNVVYIAAFKLYRGSVGDVALHNTIVKNGDALAVTSGVPHSRQYFRNNIFIGGPGDTYNGWDSGTGKVMNLTYAVDASFDYDGLGSTTGSFSGKYMSTSFASVAEMQSKTTEKHGLQVSLGVFAAAVAYPAAPFPALGVPDLRLKAGSAAVDVGEVLPNINDGFGGKAPDLGAYELGAALPAYGPR